MKMSTTIVMIAGHAMRERARATDVTKLDAPSSRDASTSEAGDERKNARIQNVPNGTDSADLGQDQRPVAVGQAGVLEHRSRAG